MKLAQKVLENSSIVLLGQVISLFLNLVTIIFLARYLGEERFGLFSFGLTFVNYLAILPNFGMKPILVREMARSGTDSQALLWHAISIKSLFSITAVIIGMLLTQSLGYSSQQKLIIAILSINLFISPKLFGLRSAFEVPYEANLEMKTPILLRIVDALLLFLLIVGGISLTLSLVSLTTLYLIALVPGFLFIVYLSVRRFTPTVSLHWQTAKWLLLESSPLAIYVILTTFNSNTDIFLLKTLSGNASVGNYASAIRLIYPLNFIPMALVASLFPLMSRYHQDSSDKLLLSFVFGFKTLFLLGIVLSLLATFFGDEIFTFIYSNQFQQARSTFVLLMWSELFLFLNFFLVDFNTSIDKQKTNTLIAGTIFIVNLLFNLLLIPHYTVMGAGIAKLLSNIVGFVLLFLLVSKRIKLALSFLWPLIRLLLFSLFGLFLLSYLHWILGLILSVFLFILVTFITHYFSNKEATIIKQSVSRIFPFLSISED
jgi:O-antigen/teichoic acid export membrane protein